MLPSRHIIVSLSLGAGMWAFSRSFFAGILCFLSGILVDVDHIIDYVANAGLKSLNLKDIYWTCANLPHQREESKLKKVFLIFHAWEIAILLWMGYLLSRNIYLLSIALGYTSHLSMDNAAHHTFHPLTYFITYRLRKGFKTIKLFKALREWRE